MGNSEKQRASLGSAQRKTGREPPFFLFSFAPEFSLSTHVKVFADFSKTIFSLAHAVVSGCSTILETNLILVKLGDNQFLW